MRTPVFILAILFCTSMMAADPAVRTVKATKVIGDPRLRVSDDIPRIRMSPDGKHLVSCCNDGTIRWWDVATRKETKRWAPEKPETLWDFLFLPNDRMLVSTAGKEVLLIDLKTGKKLKSYPHPSSVYRLFPSKDGTRFLACGDFKTTMLWDVATGKKTQSFKDHKSDVYCAVFSHDESRVYTCGEDGTWRSWVVETGAEHSQKNPQAEDLYVLERHPTKELMAVCSEKTGMWVVDLEKEKTLWKSAIGKKVQSAAWSPDGTRIAANGDTLVVMDLATGKKSMDVKLPKGYNWGLCWSPDGKRLYTTTSNVILEFDATTGKRIFPAPEVKVLTGSIRRVQCIDAKGTIYFRRGGEGVHRMDGKTGALQKPLLEKIYVRSMAMSPDGSLLACGGSSGKIWVVNTRDGSTKYEKTAGEYSQQTMRFSPDGKRLYVGSSDGEIYVWRMKDGNRDGSFSRKTAEEAARPKKNNRQNVDDIFAADLDSGFSRRYDVEHIDVSPDGQLLAAVYEDNTVMIWGIASGKIIETIRGDGSTARPSKCCFLKSKQLRLLLFGQKNKNKTLLAIWETPVPAELTMSEDDIAAWIKKLGGDSFRVRRKATKTLTALGPNVVPYLRKVDTKDDPEIAFRIKKVLVGIEEGNKMKQLKHAFDPKSVQDVGRMANGKDWFVINETLGKRHLEVMTVSDGKVVSTVKMMDDNRPNTAVNTSSGEVITGNGNGTFTIYKTK